MELKQAKKPHYYQTKIGEFEVEIEPRRQGLDVVVTSEDDMEELYFFIGFQYQYCRKRKLRKNAPIKKWNAETLSRVLSITRFDYDSTLRNRKCGIYDEKRLHAVSVSEMSINTCGPNLITTSEWLINPEYCYEECVAIVSDNEPTENISKSYGRSLSLLRAFSYVLIHEPNLVHQLQPGLDIVFEALVEYSKYAGQGMLVDLEEVKNKLEEDGVGLTL